MYFLQQSKGAWQIVKTFALSLLDQWLISTNKKSESRSTNITIKDDDNDEPSSMRYLFLLGVLPTTFGSLYALGYSSLQIMVIGAYIVTSYFALVETAGTKPEDQEISKVLEQVLAKVIEDQEEEKEVDYQPHNEFKLSALLDDKSKSFIAKFDSVFSKLRTS